MSEQIEYRGFWEGPRWARISTALERAAHLAGIDCFMKVDKGWIRESGQFTLKGDATKVRAVYGWLNQAMEDYNK